jgi:hypothetical protein
MSYLNRVVVEYSDYQYEQISHKQLIKDTVERLEYIIRNPKGYIEEEDEWDFQMIIDDLKKHRCLGSCTTFPFKDFIDDLNPDDDKIYVITKDVMNTEPYE